MESPKNNQRVNLPREHGAWAMFLVPLGVGMATGKVITLATILFALTAFGFFLLRYPLMLTMRARDPHTRREAIRWSIVYATLTSIGGALLVARSPLWYWLALGALGALTLVIYLWLATRRAEMSLAGEWLGVAGLALGAPGAYLVATGMLDVTALELYALLRRMPIGARAYAPDAQRSRTTRLRSPSSPHWQSVTFCPHSCLSHSHRQCAKCSAAS